jgi:cytochrome c oxidase assembly factor CtaG
MKRCVVVFAAISMLCSAPALAHDISAGERGPDNAQALWRSWGLEPAPLAGLTVAALLYGIGIAKTWRAAGVGRGVRRWEAACFAAGWLTLFAALVSPLHRLGQILFSAHMAQHELLMLVAAPLIVLGRPTAVCLRALPRDAARSLGRLASSPAWTSTWHAYSTPLTAWTLHAVILWAWHVPGMFQATLHSEVAHAAQHCSFIGVALLFWTSIVGSFRRGDVEVGVAVASLFTTALHSGLLGALLTFARSPWYPDYDHTQWWGLTALEDQQLGGLIMWVPACTVYIAAALAIAGRYLARSRPMPGGIVAERRGA